MNPIRRSTRNMFQSFHFNDVVPSQDNLFSSQMSGMGLFSSHHNNGEIQRQPSNDDNRPLRLRPTSSYDKGII